MICIYIVDMWATYVCSKCMQSNSAVVQINQVMAGSHLLNVYGGAMPGSLHFSFHS